jgi:aromatic-L-amino-acid decarboxylase
MIAKVIWGDPLFVFAGSLSTSSGLEATGPVPKSSSERGFSAKHLQPKMESNPTLELSSEEMRRLVALATEAIIRHIESLPNQPAVSTEGGTELARSLIEKMPTEGVPAEQLIDLLFQKVFPKSFTTAGPGYLAYIPGGGLFHSAVADLIADAANRYVGVFAAAPGLAQIEANVLRWFCEMVGYPAGARGILTSGGSLAAFSAVITARRDRLEEDLGKGTLYLSDQTHHSIHKAAMLAGFPSAAVREIPSDERFRIQIQALLDRLADDRRAGFKPFLLIGNAGTVNTGAVDDLEALAAVARKERLWFHVDGAYGGFFVLTHEGRARLKGIEQADSIVLDPHKGLFLPYGTGSLLVREGVALKRAHQLSADYLPTMQEDPEFVDFCLLSPELSRSARGLRVWLPLKMHGVQPFRRNLEEKLELARWATEELRKTEEMEILAEPQLSIVAFRLNPGRLEPESLNELNRTFLELINARKRVFLTGTKLGERFALRICVLSFRTHLDRMRMALEDIRAAAREALQNRAKE